MIDTEQEPELQARRMATYLLHSNRARLCQSVYWTTAKQMHTCGFITYVESSEALLTFARVCMTREQAVAFMLAYPEAN